MSEIHFLDTNMLLAMVLPKDNQYNTSKEYFNYYCCRYISNTASDEAKGKIKKLRKISLKISNYVKEYSLNNTINPLKLNKHLSDVQRRFLNQYNNESFPESLKKENFDKVVSDFFCENSSELINILLSENNDEFNKKLWSSFRKSHMNLFKFLKQYICITFINSLNKKDALKKIGVDNKDAILLEESYILYILLNKKIQFITFDGGILELSHEINEVITHNINIVHPMEFNYN